MKLAMNDFNYPPNVKTSLHNLAKCTSLIWHSYSENKNVFESHCKIETCFTFSHNSDSHLSVYIQAFTNSAPTYD